MSSIIAPILSITGSDGTGGAGIQADVKTISTLGGLPLSVVTAITIQNTQGIHCVYDVPSDIILQQTSSVIQDFHPKAIKIGMLRDADTIRAIGNEIIFCTNIVCDPGILSSNGTQLLTQSAIDAIVRYIIPETRLLLLRCNEAEHILHTTINTDNDMLSAARMLTDKGAHGVLLRGGRHATGLLTALLYISAAEGEESIQYFTTPNTEGWQMHGIGGTLSSSIATRFAFGDDIPTAVRKAHDYLHSQVIYSIASTNHSLRQVDIYNRFASLIADNYTDAHDVNFYADRLCVTPRYLSQVTQRTIGKTPKQVISDYLAEKSKTLLLSTPKSIQQIAQSMGFTSQASFTKFFHNYYNCSPSEFRSSE